MTGSGNSSFGEFAPVMPAFIRLLAGVIVLVAIEAIVLGFPGISENMQGTSISYASLAVFFIGLVVAFVILKFGTQVANALGDVRKTYRTWSPILAYVFQIVAVAVLYAASNQVASIYFTSVPWAYALIFLLIALIPTLKVVVNVVHALEGHPVTPRHDQN